MRFLFENNPNSSQHKRLQNHMKPPKLNGIQLLALALGVVFDVFRKPLFKVVVLREDGRHYVVEQRP